MRLLPNAAQMRTADHYTINVSRIPAFVLMERAAAALVQSIYRWNLDLRRVCIVCGSGNNGGDGFAIGRMLLQDGYSVEIVSAVDERRQSADCKRQMDWYLKQGGQILHDWNPDDYSIIIDALFGVGLSREVQGAFLGLIQKINGAHAIRVAVDIPSGLSANTGQPLGDAVHADYTVTFQFLKFGMAVYPGKSFCGKIEEADIGISKDGLIEAKDVVVMWEPDDYRKKMPERTEDSNKGTFGKVLVIAGSKGMSGAAYFNAKAAYLAGAGVVHIYTAEENRVILQQQLPEALITGHKTFNEAQLTKLLDWADVVCMGSGIGKGKMANDIVKTVLSYNKTPGVIDADALNILAENPELFPKENQEQYVLTPHMMEMSRLCGATVEEIKKNRVSALFAWRKAHRSVCVLKDSKTMIAGLSEDLALNDSGNSAMAKAGSGDVLAGMITGLMAQGVSGMDAAVIGTFLHGRAGDLARGLKGAYSVLATDILENISLATMEISSMS